MFYLIGGSPRSGKTTIVKSLSKKLGIPWISTDTLELVVMKYVTDDELKKLFPKTVIRRLTNQTNDEMYTTYTSEEIVGVYIEQGNSLAQGIEMFIECEATYNHDYILEGYHILPELVSRLENKFNIKAVFVGREDIVETLQSITNHSQENDWVIKKTKDAKTYPLIAKMLTVFSSRIKKEAEEKGFKYFSMDSNFKETSEIIVENFLK